jgi:hypothetical protein
VTFDEVSVIHSCKSAIMPARPIFSTTGVFIAAAIIALAYTWATDHQWEDYWITFRSSKNLATGNGLVHNVGEPLHSFTSPLGVLLPALGSVITGNSNDIAALWAFRVMCIAAFAGAAALMFATAKGIGLHPLAAGFLVLWLLTDNKSQDFSANGMETSFLLLFIAYAMWGLFIGRGPWRWLHLGLSWGGLMWTRPDAFIYIGTMGLAALIFNDSARSGLTRKEWLVMLLKAAGVCTIVYLPWFITAWAYYGTPVPHTIIAKASAAGPKNPLGIFWSLICQPVHGLTSYGPIEGTFTPSNLRFGGWPLAVEYICRLVALLSFFIWLLPRVRWEARLASFVYAVFMAYLDYFPAYPASWYLPGPAWLALFALAGLLDHLLPRRDGVTSSWRAKLARPALLASTTFVLLGIWMSLHAGRLFAVQQKIVDGGNRRDIGLWLKEHAKPGDTVFMECLGYIGYFSGLRSYDWPGMSSPEVVKASKECDHNWQLIVARLKPDWLVLRPQEATIVLHGGTAENGARYELVRTFDVTGKLEKLDVHGTGLLAFDSCFFVFQRVEPVP